MTSPDIREIQVFLSLVHTGSFSAAAKYLGITQPAVSAQIAKLEQVLGFPLFYRNPEGTVLTEQGKALIPLLEEIEKEHIAVLRRAAYWKRAQTKQVKIWADGSISSRKAHYNSNYAGSFSSSESWKELSSDADWLTALKTFEVDIVITGSFLKSGDGQGIKTLPLERQRGVTLAWDPTYYNFVTDPFDFLQAITATVILPARSMAIGFREFLIDWCETAYSFPLREMIECKTEAEAVDACKLGLGVLVLPGDAEKRLALRAQQLGCIHAFNTVLPRAFTFGIRYRAEEQNPLVLSTVELLAKRLSVL